MSYDEQHGNRQRGGIYPDKFLRVNIYIYIIIYIYALKAQKIKGPRLSNTR